MRTKILCALFACSFFCSSCLKQKEDTPATTPPTTTPTRVYDWPKIADSAQTALLLYFWNASGKYFTVQPNTSAFNGNYWPNAHALDVLTDMYLRKNRDAAVKRQMDDLIAGLRTANSNTYINYYYDDMEWLLISSLRAWRETGDVRYKNVCDILWADVKGGWDNQSGGGFYWRKDRVNKNTPANAPACIYIARSYQVSNAADELNWTRDIYAWLKNHMIKSNGDVWDGLYLNSGAVSYDTRLFTYNYGTVIGSALELWKITGDQQYRDEAVRVAGQAISGLSRDGVLPAGDNGDGGLFNGIFVRYLTRLIVEGNLPESTKRNYIDFLKKNAETMWSKGTNSLGMIGADWRSAPNTTTLTPQLSGVMLAEAMAELKKLNLL